MTRVVLHAMSLLLGATVALTSITVHRSVVLGLPVGLLLAGAATVALVAVEKDAWYFDGLTVRRDGPDGMVGAVRIDSKEGPPREAVFKYRRVK